MIDNNITVKKRGNDSRNRTNGTADTAKNTRMWRSYIHPVDQVTTRCGRMEKQRETNAHDHTLKIKIIQIKTSLNDFYITINHFKQK